jgi:tetratricopeptide (TPR) repeat protein
MPQAYAYLGLVAAAEGHNDEALHALEKAVGMIDPAADDYRVFSIYLATQLVAMQRNDQAFSVVDPIIAKWPTYSRAWYVRAVIEYQLGDLPAARSDTVTALRLEPNFVQAQNLLTVLNTPTEAPSH